jgi:hypothetical protein
LKPQKWNTLAGVDVEKTMRFLLVVTLFACLAPTARADDGDNSFRKAKVGDWAEYKMTTNAMGKSLEQKVRMTVTAKDDKEATVETTGKQTFMGQELDIPAQRQKIHLSKPYDPTSLINLPKSEGVKLEKTGTGTEKVSVGGKEYETTWTTVKLTAKGKDTTLESETKVWISKEVPLFGMVKVEMTSAIINMTLELTGTGSKSKSKE